MGSDVRRSKAFRDLKASLLNDLERRGLTGSAYTDKVDEYMDFWVRRQELRADVAKRGLRVIDERGRVSENRSVSLEIQVSRQMLALFTAMGFKPDALNGGDSDDDDDL